MTTPGHIALPLGETAQIDRAALDKSALRWTLDEAILHARRTLTMAEAIDAPTPVRDALFIASTRLQSALTLLKQGA